MIKSLNPISTINEVEYSAAARIKIIFNCVRDPVAMRPGAQVASAELDGFFDRSHGIGGRGQKGGVLPPLGRIKKDNTFFGTLSRGVR